MTMYREIRYNSADGLTLYARDYVRPSTEQAPLVLCLHGLTRNSADFEDIALHLAEKYRVVVPDQRGRGLSDWDSNSARYQLPTYVADTFSLLRHLDIAEASIIGTSMGGLMALLMHSSQPELIKAVVLNDVGPEIHPAGLARIRGYVGKTRPAENWPDAIATVEQLNRVAFPDYNEEDWVRMAKRLYHEDNNGVPVLAYDPALAAPMEQDVSTAVPPDLWPLFEGLGETPALALRGSLSDILSADCFTAMQRRLPGLKAVTIPQRGHAPDLSEPESIGAIDRFLNAHTGEH
ncbi:alpha/beta fold hydrolase [Microbulbifer guangxiensis]|uniref:alpha/beta fold hydrolase n=1 Tax=Microbulbifer guangxiensis TaxID=2904249 RepID=UPI001F3DB576|nr:alpha/beta hydrolase [Microbulbifer guangxiensis]